MKSRMSVLFVALLIGAPAANAQSGAPAANAQSGAPAANAQSGAPGMNVSRPSAVAAKPDVSPAAAGAAVRKEEDCGCEAPNNPDDVAAIVNGARITNREIDDQIKDEKAGLEKQVVDARRRELNLQINSRLLEAEAKRKGTTAANLLGQEVVAAVKEPTQADAQAFYEANKTRIPGSFTQYRQQIIDFLKAQREEAAAKKFADKLRTGAEVKILVEMATVPKNETDRATVLATINGEKITSGDVEDALKPLIYDVQQRVYSLRRTELELKINDLLLEAEAQKRKITPKALIDAELTPNVKKVGELDAKKFFDENRGRIEGDFEQVKEQIVDYLQKKEQHAAELAFTKRLRDGAKIEVKLKEPESPVFKIATDDRPSRGKAEAAVTIVEFTDFECPTCQQSQPVIEKLLQEYPNNIRLVVKDYPLERHKNAFKAAEAAEAARQQGKYWDYSALLFENQNQLGIEKLKEYASKLGLDRLKFDAELDAGKYAAKVQRDIQDGMRAGVNATPAIFVNGRRVSDRSYAALRTAVEEALRAAAQQLGDS